MNRQKSLSDMLSWQHEPAKQQIMMSILTVMPLTVPSSSLIVKTSSRAWVGCSPTPSPALITGLRQWREALWEEERRRRGGTLASKLRQLCFIVVAEDSPPRLQAAGVAAPERRRSSSWSGRSRPESLPSAWTRWIRRSGPRSRPDAAWRQQRSWRCECWLRRTSTPSLYPGRCISGLSWEYNISTAVNKRFSRGAARPSGFPGFALSGPSDVECGPHWKGVRSETKDEKNKHISDLKTPKYCTCAVIKPSSDKLINSNCCTDPQGSEHDKWTSVIL